MTSLLQNLTLVEGLVIAAVVVTVLQFAWQEFRFSRDSRKIRKVTRD